jgi:hypothetical protein
MAATASSTARLAWAAASQEAASCASYSARRTSGSTVVVVVVVGAAVVVVARRVVVVRLVVGADLLVGVGPVALSGRGGAGAAVGHFLGLVVGRRGTGHRHQ